MSVIIEAGDTGNQTLDAHKVKIIQENIDHYDERSRNLVNAIDSDLNYKKKGMFFTSNTYQRTGPKAMTDRNDRYTDHDTKRLKKGTRQVAFEDFYDACESSDFEEMEEMVSANHENNIAMGEGKNNFRDSFIMNRMFTDMNEAVDAPTDAYGTRHTFQTVAFPAGQVIAQTYDKYWDGKSDAKDKPTTPDQGLNKNKLLGAREVTAKARFKGKKVLIATELDLLNLATSLNLTSGDFVDKKLLVDIERIMAEESELFLGMRFKIIEGENQVGHETNAAECALTTERNIQYRERQVVQMAYQRLGTRHFNHQLYYSLQAALLRKDDLGTAKILVNQTVTPI